MAEQPKTIEVPVEELRHLVDLAANMKNHPPTSDEQWTAFHRVKALIPPCDAYLGDLVHDIPNGWAVRGIHCQREPHGTHENHLYERSADIGYDIPKLGPPGIPRLRIEWR